MRISIVLIERQSRAAFRKRLVGYPQLRQTDSQIVMCFRKIGPDSQGSPEGNDRVSPITLIGEGVAEIVLSFRVIGEDLKSLFEMDHSLIQSSFLFHQGVAEVVLGNVIV